jgi:hypothetical protein
MVQTITFSVYLGSLNPYAGWGRSADVKLEQQKIYVYIRKALAFSKMPHTYLAV